MPAAMLILADDLREDLAALGVRGPFSLDGRPLRVTDTFFASSGIGEGLGDNSLL